MKTLLLISTMFFFACSNGNNKLMTDLVNEEAQLDSTIKDANNRELYYMGLVKEANRELNDTVKMNLYVDSSTQYFMIAKKATDRKKQVAFSIDSLSKMK